MTRIDSDLAAHDHQHNGKSPDASNSLAARAPLNNLTLKVDGMTCASCAATVQHAIESKPGVRRAAVNVIDGRATIEGENLDAAEIAQAVRAQGFEARAIDDLPAVAELRSEIELRQMRHERLWKRRAIIAISIWVPLEALHWVGQVAGWHMEHAIGWMDWLMFAGSTTVMIAAGGGFYHSAWNAAKRGATNMDTLIAIGASAAYVFSLVVFIARHFGELHEQPLYFAEAAALLGLISLGHWMEARATAKAGSAVRELLQLQPDEAEIVNLGRGFTPPVTDASAVPDSRRGQALSYETHRIPSADVQPGDRLLIRPGARVPVDGVVVDGASEVDEAVVTGESVPVTKRIGASVVAGSMNTTGQLIVEANVDGRHTTISRIAEMVTTAQTSKADIQRLADYVSSIFVPTVLVIALLTIVGWTVVGDFTRGVIAMTTVLIISCPCALGLATPMAVMVGAGAASRRGILVKSAAALETAGNATHVIFDKTGTLTIGKPRVVAVEIDDQRSSISEGEMLRLAAAVEMPSEHPIARAIVIAANERGLEVPAVTNFKATPGEGVRGEVDGRAVQVLKDANATCRVLVNGEQWGTITVADEPRADAKEAIVRLRAMGVTAMMLSGDRRVAAEAVGARIGLRPGEIEADATPEDKVRFVQGQTSKPGAAVGTATRPGGTPGPPLIRGGAVIMVGDGINDAAALAAADLGLAMASGTNIAIESADVVIPGDRVMAVADTIDIARQTLRTIKQNLFFAFFYNAAAIPAAALGLLGPYGPLFAAAAMGFSDVTVIGNALRLKAWLSKTNNRRR